MIEYICDGCNKRSQDNKIIVPYVLVIETHEINTESAYPPLRRYASMPVHLCQSCLAHEVEIMNPKTWSRLA